MTVVWGGDFNLFFHSFLDADGGKPKLKMNSLTKLLSIMSERDLCDLFRVRNPDIRRFNGDVITHFHKDVSITS